MKMMAIVLTSLLVAACASSPKAGSSLTSQNDKNGPAGSNAAATAVAKVDLAKLNDEVLKLEKQSDYFDYSKFGVKTEYQGIIRMEAEFIKSHRQDFVTLEGNADERGSEHYNLELGNKRALAIEQSLLALGVPAAQIKVVSLGEDKPRLTCHEEKCWKENRRVDFIHQLN